MLLHLALLVLSLSVAPQERPADCGTWQNCRQLALQAAEQQDFEAFHDLAWRAVRKGPAKNPDLMRMLARAQSLSGRPLDALVMLQRLLEMGVVTDAATNDDFRRVRALSGWADFERRVEALNAPAGTAPSAAAAPRRIRPRGRACRRASPRPAAATGGAPSAAAARTAPDRGDASEALRFTTLAFTPAGLAYDASPTASSSATSMPGSSRSWTKRRSGSRTSRLRLRPGSGPSRRSRIDAHEGDLWVVSSPAGAAGRGEGEPTAATLHKLQLISGRVLYAIALDESFGAARFTDVAVTPRSAVLVLDSAGRRIFSAAAKARRLELALPLEVQGPTSLAPQSDSIVYVAHAGGIVRADLAARRARPLAAAKSIDLTGFTRLRWHRDSLIGIQRAGDNSYRVVRLTLDATGHEGDRADGAGPVPADARSDRRLTGRRHVLLPCRRAVVSATRRDDREEGDGQVGEPDLGAGDSALEEALSKPGRTSHPACRLKPVA